MSAQNTAGELLFKPEQMNEIAIAVDKAKLQLHAHAIGDRAVRVTLDAYEAARKANGERDSRHQITHLELIDPADIPRFKPLGVLANIQALWAYPDTYIVDLTEPKLGPRALRVALSLRRAEEGRRDARRLKRLERVVDEPAGGDPDRRDPAGHRRRQRPRADAAAPAGADGHAAGLTVNGAYAAFDEAKSGTLTVGKRADIVVLDKDITKVPPTEIATAKVLVTLIDGAPVYEGEGLPEAKGRGVGSRK